MFATVTVFARQFLHGTKAELRSGDLITTGHESNFRPGAPLAWVYMSGTLDAAIWGSELAAGPGRERIYLVEPTGPIEDDPNVTDRKFSGNPTLSYRSREPSRVVAEVVGWHGHPPEVLGRMRDGLARLASEGKDVILD